MLLLKNGVNTFVIFFKFQNNVVRWRHLKLIIQIPSFFSPLIGHSSFILHIQKNTSLRLGKKDMDSPGFKPPVSQSIRPQDHTALHRLWPGLFYLTSNDGLQEMAV